MPAGDGSFYLYLHGLSAKRPRPRSADRVSVEVAFDAAYRSGPTPLPAWFRKALKRIPKALAAWSALIPSRQKEIVRYLTALKSPEARARNAAKALRVLSGTKDRSWPGPGATEPRLRLQMCWEGLTPRSIVLQRRPVSLSTSLLPALTRHVFAPLPTPSPRSWLPCTGLVVQCGEAE